MEIGILGPLSVRVGTTVIAPSAPKLRNVLATLVVHADQVVPASALIRELWDKEPPVSAVTTLQTYILNLRKLLTSVTGLSAAAVSREILITRAGGYLFQVGPGSLDLHRYHALAVSGREALSAGDNRVGMRSLDEALRLWRGPALVDVQGGSVLECKRRQLEESRLIVLEYLVNARLRLGMYREVLTELVALTSQYPLREGLHAQYMWALSCSGRRAQALEVFRQLRATLVAELGIEPGVPAQRLHRAILNSDGQGVQGEEFEQPLHESLRSTLREITRSY